MNLRTLGAILWLPLAYLALTWPYFDSYLEIPNRHLLSWDPALHAKDGIVLYLQLTRFDLVSFLYSLINSSFWMPLHPLLVAITSFFFPFQYDAYVYLNFLALAACLGWASLLCNAAESLNAWKKVLISLGILFFLMRIGNSVWFMGTHIQIMLESLAIGLTIVFALASLLEDMETTKKPRFVKNATIALSLLFFTKVQYGLFFGAAYFLKHIYLERLALFGARGLSVKIFKELAKKKGFIAVLIVFLIFGVFALTAATRLGVEGIGVPDGIWALCFVPLLILTWLAASKNHAISGIRKETPHSIATLTRWIILPFGWFYLLPFRHKIRWLLHNTGNAAAGTPADTLSRMFVDLSRFLDVSLGEAMILPFLLLAMGIAIHRRNPGLRVHVAYSFGLFLLFYLPMTFFAGATMTRLSATWVTLFPVVTLVWFAILVQKRSATIVVTILAGILTLHEYAGFNPHETVLDPEKNGFLKPDHQSIGTALREFDFRKGGVIYGLGTTMDAATILFDLEALRHHEEYSSVLLKREDRALVCNDFGRSGNSNPLETILRRADREDTTQILLFKSGFKPDEISALATTLVADKGFQTAVEDRNLILLRKVKSSLKKEKWDTGMLIWGESRYVCFPLFERPTKT